MNGVTYSGGQGKWTATGKYYWPTDKNVQFFGYSDGSNFTAPATGYPTLSFTIGATFDVQKDFVVAALSSTKPENNASVQLSFKHILTNFCIFLIYVVSGTVPHDLYIFVSHLIPD